MSRRITQRELRNDTPAIMRAIEDGRLPLLTHNPADFASLSPLLIMIGLDDK